MPSHKVARNAHKPSWGAGRALASAWSRTLWWGQWSLSPLSARSYSRPNQYRLHRNLSFRALLWALLTHKIPLWRKACWCPGSSHWVPFVNAPPKALLAGRGLHLAPCLWWLLRHRCQFALPTEKAPGPVVSHSFAVMFNLLLYIVLLNRGSSKSYLPENYDSLYDFRQ